MRRFDGLYHVIQNPVVRKRARLIGVISGFLAVVFGTMAGFGFPRAVFGANVSISGTVYQTNETSVLATGPTVRAKVNGAGDYSIAAAAGGTYTISNVTVVAGDVITVYLDGATEKAATYTVGTALDMTGIDLYQDRIATRCDNTCSLTNANINQWDKDNDIDIHATAAGAAPVTLTVDNDWKLRVSANTFAPGGSITMSTGGVNSYSGDVSIAASSTLDMAGNALSISGSYSNSGTFTSTSNTTTFTSTASGKTLAGTMTGSSAFYNLTFNGVSGAWTFNAAVAVTNDFTGTNGSVTASGNNLTVTRDFTLANTAGVDYVAGSTTVTVSRHWTDSGCKYTEGTSTIAMTGTGTISVPYSVCINNLSVGYSTFNTTFPANAFYMSGVLTFNGGTATAGAAGYFQLLVTSANSTPIVFASATTLTGSYTILVQSNAAGPLTITVAGGNYGSWGIDVNASNSGITYQLAGDVTTTGMFRQRDGSAGNAIFNTQNYNITAANYRFGQTGGGCLASTANWGSSTITLTGTFGNALYVDSNCGPHVLNMQTSHLDITGAGANIRFVNGTGTITVNAGTSVTTTKNTSGTVSVYSNSQSFYDFTLNGSGGTTQPQDAFSVTNDLTMTAGTLNGTQNVTVNGNVAGTAGIISLTGGTFEQRVSTNKNFGTTSGSTAWTFSSLTFSNSNGLDIPATITTQTGGSGGITVSSILLVGKAADPVETTLDAGNRTWTLSGTGGDPFQILASPAGSLTASTSTFTYTGANGSGNTTVQAATYCNLSVGGSTADTLVLEGATVTSNAASCGNLTINAPSGLGSNTLDTVSGSNHALTIGGNYANNSAFTARAGTVTFSATDTGNTLSGTLSGSSGFYNLVFNGSGGEWTPGAAVAVTNDLTMTAGTLLGTQNVTVNGNVAGTAGIINLTGGTFEQRIETAKNFGATSGSAAWTFNDLTFSHGVCDVPGTATVTTQTSGSGGLTIGGVLRVGKSGDNASCPTALNAGNRTWTLSGTGGDPFQLLASPAGVLTASTSTFTYTGIYASGSTTIQAATYYNLTINEPTNVETYVLEGATSTSNDFTLTLGTFDTVSGSNYALSVTNDLTISGGSFTARNSTITVGRHWTYNSGATFTRGGSTVVLNGTGNIAGTGSTQFENLSIGYSTKTTTLAATTNRTDAFGTLTLNGGTVTSSATYSLMLIKAGAGTYTPLVFASATSLTGTNVQLSFRATVTGITINIPAGDYGLWDIYTYASAGNSNTWQLSGDITTSDSVNIFATSGVTGTTFNTQNYAITAKSFLFGQSTQTAAVAANFGSSTLTFSNTTNTAFGVNSNGGSHTLNMGSSSITVTGSVYFTQGTGTITVTPGTSTLTWANTSGTLTYAPNGQSLYNLTLNGSGSTVTPNGAVDIDNDLTMTAGTLNGTQNITVNGNVAGTAGIISLTGGTFEQRVAADKNFGTTSGSTAWTFSSLTFSNGCVICSGNARTITTQTGGSGGITVSSVLSVGKAADGDPTTLNAGNRTWTLSGTGGDPFQLLASPAGTLTASTSTFYYYGKNSGGNTTVQTATYYNATIGCFGTCPVGTETYVLEAATTVSSDLSISASTTLDTVSGQNYGLTIGGNYSNSGTFTAQSGTVTFNATDTGNTLTGTLSGSSAFYNLTFNGVGGAWTPGADTGITNVLALTNGTLDASSRTITLSGTTGTPFTTGGTFTPNTSTVAYTGNNAGGNTSVAVVTYYNLTLNNASETYVLGGTTTASNNLTISAGTLDVTAANYELRVAGTFSNSDSFTARAGKVILNGTSQTIAGSTTFYDLEKITGSATLTFTAGTTQTIGHQTTLKGTGAGALLSLRSSSSGTQWRFDPQGERDINFVDVQDSYNINAAHITTAYLTIYNSGNNTGWDFGSTSSGGGSGTRAPSNLTGEGLSTSSIIWRWSDNSTTETGFKVKNTSDETVCTVSSVDVTSCTETGLNPNTSYSRYVVATTSGGQTGGSGVASASTLSTGPSASSVTSDKSTQTWYRKGSTHSGLRVTGDEFTFTNSIGFSAGDGVDHFRYAFEPSSTHTWSGTESKWSSGTLTATATHTSDAWYLHLKGYNAQGLENGTLTVGPYYYDDSAPKLSLEKIGTLIFNKYTARTTTTEQRPTFTGKLSEQGTVKLLIEKRGFAKFGLGYGAYITATITTDENGNFSWTPTLEPGTYRVTLVGADRAGNESDALKFNLRILLPEEAGIQEPAEEELAPSPTPVTGIAEPEIEETATTKPISLIKPPNLFWKYFFESLGEEWDSLTYPIKLAGFTIGKLAQQALAALASQLQLAFSGFEVDFSFDQRLGGFEPWYAVEFPQRLGGFLPLRDVLSTAMLPIATQYPQSVDRLLAVFSPVTNWTSAVARKAASGVQSVSNSVGSVVLKVGEQAQTVSDRVGFKIVEFGYRFVDDRTIITDVEIAVLSSTSAKITWKTNHPATSKINYGTSTTYTEEAQSSRRVSEHEFLLENLAPNTQYFFEVMSQNKNYVYDANRAFKTPPQK